MTSSAAWDDVECGARVLGVGSSTLAHHWLARGRPAWPAAEPCTELCAHCGSSDGTITAAADGFAPADIGAGDIGRALAALAPSRARFTAPAGRASAAGGNVAGGRPALAAAGSTAIGSGDQLRALPAPAALAAPLTAPIGDQSRPLPAPHVACEGVHAATGAAGAADEADGAPERLELGRPKREAEAAGGTAEAAGAPTEARAHAPPRSALELPWTVLPWAVLP